MFCFCQACSGFRGLLGEAKAFSGQDLVATFLVEILGMFLSSLRFYFSLRNMTYQFLLHDGGWPLFYGGAVKKLEIVV